MGRASFSRCVKLSTSALFLLGSGLLSGCGRIGFEVLDAAVEVRDAGVDAPARDSEVVEAVPNLAFVTEGSYTGALGGVAGADAVCNAEAADAGLVGDFVAMLRASDRPSPADLLAGSRGWTLVDGTWVADLPSQVADGSFLRPIHTTQHGRRIVTLDGFRVWTGANGVTCEDWTNEGALGDQHWIPQWRRLSDGERACSDAHRLFCFERGHVVARVPTPITQPRIFVSSGLFTPGAGGLTAADAFCDAEASAAGLPSARALLPTTTESALDRTGRRSYQRVDGVVIGVPGTGTQDGYVILDASGATPADSVAIWTGGPPELPSLETCGDWASTTGEGREGSSSDWPGYSGYLEPCTSARHLYCVER